MFCAKCGKEIDAQALMCPNCGEPNNTKPGIPQMPYAFYAYGKADTHPSNRKVRDITTVIAVLLVVIFLGYLGNKYIPIFISNSVTAARQTTVPVPLYEVNVKNTTVVTADDGTKNIIIEYKYTNNSDTAEAFVYALTDTVYQNGVECPTDYYIPGYDLNGQMLKVLPGNSTIVRIGYELQNDTDVITIIVNSWLDTDNVICQASIVP